MLSLYFFFFVLGRMYFVVGLLVACQFIKNYHVVSIVLRHPPNECCVFIFLISFFLCDLIASIFNVVYFAHLCFFLFCSIHRKGGLPFVQFCASQKEIKKWKWFEFNSIDFIKFVGIYMLHIQHIASIFIFCFSSSIFPIFFSVHMCRVHLCGSYYYCSSLRCFIGLGWYLLLVIFSIYKKCVFLLRGKQIFCTVGAHTH